MRDFPIQVAVVAVMGRTRVKSARKTVNVCVNGLHVSHVCHKTKGFSPSQPQPIEPQPNINKNRPRKLLAHVKLVPNTTFINEK